MKVLKVEVHRNETSQPIIYGQENGHSNVNSYTKGPMQCVLFESNGETKVHKYPLESLFRVVESYEGSGRK